VNHLSDVMPLLVHFHSVHAQLQSSLAELQTRLDAVDVPIGGGANTETIRTELRDAQVRDDHTATAECPSVCPSVPSIDLAAAAGGFAVGHGRLQQISIGVTN